MDFQDQDIIKVLTGIRRSGKSTMLDLFIEHLRAEGVKEDRIVSMNFESAEFEDIIDHSSLYQYVKDRISQNGRTYIFLDEIQNVIDFEKAVNSLMVDFDVDIYITGSNAYMLSSDLSTLLSGRYVEIRMYPFSFREYMSAHDPTGTPEDCFYDYMRYGGFPFLAREHEERKISAYLDGVYNTVVFKDVIARNKIKNPALMEKLVRFVFSSMGSLVSPSSIAKAIGPSDRSVANETVESYLEMLCKAHILSKTVRYDIKGKEYLKTLNKYYVTDLGLRNHVLGYRQMEPTHALENIVYFELLRRGYKVDMGKVDNMEVDFVVRNEDIIRYYQVAWTVNAPETPKDGSRAAKIETSKREFRPFDAIDDHYEKFVITMDRDPVSSVNGVRKLNALDFLLGRND